MNKTILSIETTSDLCGIALSQNSNLISEIYYIGKNLHDKFLAETVKDILFKFNLTINTLDAIAVSAGPGSFTGLRICAAFAKGLTHDNNPRLIAVPTLEAIAYSNALEANFAFDQKISVLISSHRDQSYFQQFQGNNEISEIQLIDNFTLQEKTEDTIIIHTDPLVFENYKSVNSKLVRIYPRYISALANKYFDDGKFIASENFTPNYAQNFEVKVK